MEDINILPLFRVGIGDLKDGLLIKAPEFCKKKHIKNDRRCEEHYKSIYEKVGSYQCPYGFTSYVVSNKNGNEIFTSFRLKGNFDKDRTKDKIDESTYNPVLSEDQLNDILKIYEKTDKNKEKYLVSTKFNKDILHEIRNFNSQIVNKSEDLISRMESASKKKYDHRSLELMRNIFALSSLIFCRYSVYDATVNPLALKYGSEYAVSIHNKFYKMKQCYIGEAEKKNIEIKLRGNSKNRFQAYLVFDLVPFLLFDNAIKYSPNGRDINVYFEDRSKSTTVVIESIGPSLTEEELSHIFEKEYRSINARLACENGSGIGLYLAQIICELHNIELKVDFIPADIKEKGIEYGCFKVHLKVITI